ncbi:MAG TPA: sensor domain-containing diguanylate cyclase [Candidatus Marinimicrobia bacterium]|jgi:diguanylate cyclase (GGDEF)-like protein|nr:sensor domain-containing diguanylate cyclase [Candidatus Neomarinimicrobiota bacterium]HJM69695.1 sensor domain-containing diguanylate cyclase [Candidatus Neomarinimicrobiota bacterium]|tara:strand:+ start:6983 stop:8707 length:1725 start_codon:yes stop_codon:yes gene_type:complete
MNVNRLITAAILALVCFLLFVYPDPQGDLYTVLRYISFGLLIVILYQFSTSGPDVYEPEVVPEKQQITSVSRGLDIHEDIHDQYEQLLNMVFNMVIAINETYKAAFFMLDSSGNNLVIQSSTKDGFEESIPTENEVIQTILLQEEAILFQQSDVRSHWNGLFKEKSWRGSECVLGSRVLYKNAPVGCILVQADHFSTIKERDRNLLTSLGRFVSLSMIKLDNIEKLSLDNYFHYQIANLLNSMDIQSEVRGLHEKVRDLCRSFFNYDKLTITAIEEDGEYYKVVLEDGYNGDTDPEKKYSISKSIHGRGFRSDETVESNNINEDFYEKGRFEEGDLADHDFKSILAVPVLINGSVNYCIAIEKQKSYRFISSDRNVLELLALTFGSIISWQQQYWKMHENAMHDGLTGLLNHKAFMDRFKEEISRSSRYQHNIVMAILDLDKFKRINDTYGHLYGDYVIKEVANIIREKVRNIDVVGRYGGEEYGILLIDTNIDKIVPVAKRIIEGISNYNFSMDNVDVKMTISCGLAEYPQDSDKMNELIAKADDAMYAAKAQGGNMVSVFSEESSDIQSESI